MTERIYYVDKNDSPTGETAEKLTAHDATTRLHAAFSCYVFRDDGKFLVTKRAHSKKVWPNVWTNSCCGHPMPDETRELAIARRLHYELGMHVKNLRLVVPRYMYKTPPYNGIVEHEFCPIYVALATNEPQPNPDEVAEYEWIDWQVFVKRVQADSDDYSWFASKKSGQPPPQSPQWSWWCKDQLVYLNSSKDFHTFLRTFSS